ncbi:MAG TPA: hypothetical protein VJG30_04890 [Candidatus Nanoarchaeia archaeon]|nr:hypothetical protein [Candidatus Nanoarchaeia archaeon]
MTDPIKLIPLIIATLSLAITSFLRKKDWALVAFVIWIVIFVLTFFIFK